LRGLLSQIRQPAALDDKAAIPRLILSGERATGYERDIWHWSKPRMRQDDPPPPECRP